MTVPKKDIQEETDPFGCIEFERCKALFGKPSASECRRCQRAHNARLERG